VIREHPVLLNRAPTLHRLGIQAFEPVLIEGKAIQLHPLVCAAFNADFDGDQMAVHVPLSLEAQLEARVLMMSTNNILHPANGSADHRAVAGYRARPLLLSLMREGQPGEGKIFGDMAEIEHALHQKVITLHTKIKYRWTGVDENGKAQALVRHHAGPRHARQVLPRSRRSVRRRQQADDQARNLGHDRHRLPPLRPEGDGDLLRPHHGARLLQRLQGRHLVRQGRHGRAARQVEDRRDTRTLAKDFEQQYKDGLITHGEKYNKVVDAWSKATEEIAKEMMKEISATKKTPKGADADINSIYMMAHSGARGSPAQMRQLAGMRGLMAKPSGEIIETPIISNFKEGLSVLEYFNSTHGARKGLADTALKTANSGYLTRRLVDVAQTRSSPRRTASQGAASRCAPSSIAGTVVASLGAASSAARPRKTSRIPRTATCWSKARHADRGAACRGGQLRGRAGSAHPFRAHLRDGQRRVRQVLRARSRPRHAGQHGRGGRRHRGAVDRRARHRSSTMRTFHIGGAAQITSSRSSSRASKARSGSRTRRSRATREGELVAMAATSWFASSMPTAPSARRTASSTARAAVDEGDKVKRGQRIAEWDPYTRPISPRSMARSVRGSGRRPVDCGNARRVDRHRQARGHRLAHVEPRRRTCVRPS
jgi:DNA-directed RNA polymerase subunit beta'